MLGIDFLAELNNLTLRAVASPNTLEHHVMLTLASWMLNVTIICRRIFLNHLYS